MRINSIQNNNFQGKYIDRSNQNGGFWYMEYKPYSWESGNTSKMEQKQRLNVLAEELPNNEEIHSTTKSPGFVFGRESSKDLLGTEFAYNHCTEFLQEEKNEVVPVKAMNLEDSLKVQNEKYEKFLVLKQIAKSKLESLFFISNGDISKSHDKFLNSSKEYDNHFIKTKQRKSVLDKNELELAQKALKLSKSIVEYMQLNTSIKSVEEKKQKNLEILQQIEEAKNNDNLIDISRRDVKNPNKQLYIAMQNAEKFVNQVIALPHKIVSVKEVISLCGQNIESTEFSQRFLSFVDKLIKKTH